MSDIELLRAALIAALGGEEQAEALLDEVPEYVHDGWARYEARLETREKRGKRQWRYVIDREFARWDRGWDHGRWSRDPTKVVRRCARRMTALQPVRYDSVKL